MLIYVSSLALNIFLPFYFFSFFTFQPEQTLAFTLM